MISCNKIPAKDKGCHFIAGLFIATAVSLIVGPGAGIVSGVTAGIGKELYDKFIRKTLFSFFDMFATIVGSVVGVFVYGIAIGLLQ